MQSLNVTLVQTATVWHQPQANLRIFEDWFDAVPAQQHLVVLPEMFSTGFTMASAEVAEGMQGDTAAWLRAQAVARGWHIVGSAVIEDSGAYFNRLLWATPHGDMHSYDKRHLFRMAGEHQHYAAGSVRLVVEVDGWRVCPLVCYDLRFPVWLRNRGDYDVLLCVANWPAARRDAWNTLLRARAIENQSYACGVNVVGVDGNGVAYSGGTAAYAADGAVLEERFDAAGLVSVRLEMAQLQALRDSFPVWQDADAFSLNGQTG